MATIHGTRYDDVRNGTNDADNIYGYAGNDHLYGHGGNDSLSGSLGNDFISGGNGSDNIYGGAGADYLLGGIDGSADTFRFYMGDSPSANGSADSIADWNRLYDNIDMPYAGTSANYQEAQTWATSIAAARSQVESNPDLYEERHVFLYNASSNSGYLLSDLNGDDSFETGIVVRGAGSASAMSYVDII